MDIGKILNKSTTDYQVSMARLVLSYSRADEATQKQLLESYIAIIKEYEDEEYHNREQQQNQRMSVEELDQYLDDPRHGQSSKGEH